MPYRDLKQTGYFHDIFIQNVKHHNIVDNFVIYDTNKSVENEIKLLIVYGCCVSRYLRFS